MLFSVSAWQTYGVKTPGERLLKIIGDAVRQSGGKYRSPRDFGEQAGLANSAVSQTASRLDANPELRIGGKTLRCLAEELGLSQDQLYSMIHPPEPGKEERFPNRLCAAFRAREIDVSEEAIDAVLRQETERDAPLRYWLERMIAEDTRVQAERKRAL